MSLSDYNAILQLAATFLVVFVALEHVDKYAEIIYDRFFFLKDYVTNNFKKCKDCLIDQETLNSLHPVMLEGGTTAGKIEELKMTNQKYKSKIEEEEKDFINSLPSQFRTERMSHTCWYLFLVCVTEMFISAFDSNMSNVEELVILFLNFFAIVHVFFAWCFGGCAINGFWKYLVNYTSCLYSSLYFLLNLVVSILIACYFPYSEMLTQSFLQWMYVICGVLPYANFIVYAIWLYCISKNIKNNVKNRIEVYKELCEPLRSDCETLCRMDKMIDDIKA